MPNNKLETLLHRFCTAAKAHHEALEAMDEESANTHARMIAGLYEAILREGPAGRAGLLTLTSSNVPVIAGMAAVYSMDLNPEICLAALRRVAVEPGLLGFRASVVIERWETGTWEHPGKRSDVSS